MAGRGGGWGGQGGGRRAFAGPDKSKIEGKAVNWALIREVLKLAAPYKRQIVLFTIGTVLGSSLVAAPPLLFKQVIDVAIPNGDLGLVTKLALGAIGLILLRSLLSLLVRVQSATLGNGMVFQLRRRLYAHIQRMPVSFFVRTQTGALMSRINTDVQGAQQVLSSVIGALTSNVIQLGAVVVTMVILDFRLAALVLTVIPVFLVVTRIWGRVVQRLTLERMEASASMTAFLTERLTAAGSQVVHLYGDLDVEHAEFKRRADQVRRLMIKTSVLTSVVSLVVGLAASMATSGVYWWGGLRTIEGAITVGTVIVFVSYAERVYTPINELTRIRVDLMTAMVSFERVFEVLDFPNPVSERPGAYDLTDVKGEVIFDHVAFAYPTPAETTLPSLESPGLEEVIANSRDDTPTKVLHDVHFKARPGQMVALVGPTGAGKTTTLNLVARLADVTEGAVKIDGHDVRDVTMRSLRQAIGVVSQESHLFHDTLRANLLYAKPDATQDEIESACKIARIHDLIASLPDGYDTVAGEHGYRMSGGEKQRLAIARMILKDPKIVVLDEATAHLDSHNEKLIQEALAEVLQGRTTLVIAHRLSTVIRADQIVVLDGGRVVQTGPHDELVAEPGLYQTLYNTQFAEATV